MRDVVGEGGRAARTELGAAFKAIVEERDELLRLERFIRYAAGAAIGGVRPAALVRFSCPRLGLSRAWRRSGEAVCRDLGLGSVALGGPPLSLALLYGESGLRRTLRSRPVRRFLAGRGFPVESGFDAVLSHLSRKFAVGEGADFPHEIGVFLGYPLVDVIAFSAGNAESYPCRGYWRVYHRPDRARRTFARMDMARAAAAGTVRSERGSKAHDKPIDIVSEE